MVKSLPYTASSLFPPFPSFPFLSLPLKALKYKLLEVEELKHKLQDFNQTLVYQALSKLAEDEKAKYEERLEDSRLASIRLKERI